MKRFLALLLVTMTIFMSGCATIFSGGPSVVSIDTVPTDVKITVRAVNSNEKFSDHTPCTITLNKGNDYTIRFEYEGYQTDEIVVRRSVNGWFFGNLFLGGIIGMVVDGVTANMWQHNMQAINLELEKIKTTGQLPKQFNIDIPLSIQKEDGSSTVQYVPLTFYKII